jgi:hypothetical protein
MAGGVFVGSRVGVASVWMALLSILEWTSLLKSSRIEDNRRREKEPCQIFSRQHKPSPV